jgi:hypothetical protein
MDLIIPCLSVIQPWAEFLVSNIKPIENRPRRSNYKGLLLIHSSKKYDSLWMENLKKPELIIAKEHLKRRAGLAAALPRGYIIGSVIQTGCIEPYAECKSGWKDKEQFGLMVQGGIKFEKPFPYSGSLGIFKVNIENQLTTTDIWKMVFSLSKAKLHE